MKKLSMSREEFKAAFREVVSSEFAHIPTDESSIDFIFSEKFIKRMDKLIRAQRKSYYKFINTAAKRAAVIFAAIITLFTASLSVKAIREPVVRFIKQVYETFIHYSYTGDKTEKIEREYTITNLPYGFKQTNKIENDVSITTEFKDDLGNVIEFTQMITGHSDGYFVDNENGIVFTENVDGYEIEFFEAYDMKQAIWMKDRYALSITCYGNVSFEVIKEIIRDIE